MSVPGTTKPATPTDPPAPASAPETRRPRRRFVIPTTRHRSIPWTPRPPGVEVLQPQLRPLPRRGLLGTSIAPHLILSLKPDGPIPNEAVFLQTVCGGRPDKGMPAWCTLGMSTAQIDTIYSYVRREAMRRCIPAGRPVEAADPEQDNLRADTMSLIPLLLVLSASSPGAVAQVIDPCALLTRDEVTTVLGAQVEDATADGPYQRSRRPAPARKPVSTRPERMFSSFRSRRCVPGGGGESDDSTVRGAGGG